MTLAVTIDPMVLTNPLNGSHGHWSTAARARKRHRQFAAFVLAGMPGLAPLLREPTIVVTLVRVSPRPFDDDNLRAAFKGVRDGIADALGFRDDSDPRLRWEYVQERGEPKQNAVRIEFRPGTP